MEKKKFCWQEGYGVFFYSHSHTDRVVKYVFNQEQQHLTKTFREEYYHWLKKSHYINPENNIRKLSCLIK